MSPRSLLIGSSVLMALAAFGLLMLPAEAPPEPIDTPVPAVLTQPNGPTDPAAAVSTGRADVAIAEASTPRETIDTTGWTTGTILGDVQIAVSALPRIESIQIAVEELRNANGTGGDVTPPWSKIVRLELGRSTPTFRIDNVPFSAYGYAVTVYSPGLNGSRQTARITEQHPLEDGVKLLITTGVQFSVLLRDQDMVPVTDTDVFLVPFAEPPGRPTRTGRVDNFGSIAFEDVLSGDYRIFVGSIGQPHCPPTEVTVQASSRGLTAGVQAQGQTIRVPRGQPFKIRVTDGFYGLTGVHLRLLGDRVQWLPLEGQTDQSGNIEFPFLLPGTWTIDASKPGYGITTKQITVVDGTPPADLEIKLRPVR